jgi:hypothetical protein
MGTRGYKDVWRVKEVHILPTILCSHERLIVWVRGIRLRRVFPVLVKRVMEPNTVDSRP